MVLCGVFRVSASQEEQQSTRINEASQGAGGAGVPGARDGDLVLIYRTGCPHARAPTRTTRLLAK